MEVAPVGRNDDPPEGYPTAVDHRKAANGRPAGTIEGGEKCPLRRKARLRGRIVYRREQLPDPVVVGPRLDRDHALPDRRQEIVCLDQARGLVREAETIETGGG